MMLLLENYPKNNPDVYVAWLGDNVQETALKVTNILRSNKIKTHVDFNSKGMKSHMKKAGKLDVNYCIIIGEEEMAKDVVILKDFNARTQEEMTLEKAIEKINNVK